MQIVLIQSPLPDDEVQRLIQEFPQYLFIASDEKQYHLLDDTLWEQVEILYGTKLSAQDLARAPRLRWIHAVRPNLSAFCLDEIEKRGNIIITRAKEENVSQIGEYVMGVILAFAKMLFDWYSIQKSPSSMWDHKLREMLWTLKGRLFLQIGLDAVGGEIASQAKHFGMTVWGVDFKRSFHPHCEQVLPIQSLHEALSRADIVSVALPRERQNRSWFGTAEFEKMKDDVILTVIGTPTVVDEEALVRAAACPGKFRGILLDVPEELPISPHSKLWGIPNLLITPEVAPKPRLFEKESFHLFRQNLRHYQ